MKELIKKHWKKILITICAIIIVIFLIKIFGLGWKFILSLFGIGGISVIANKMNKQIEKNNEAMYDEIDKAINSHNSNADYDKQFVLDRKRDRQRKMELRKTGKKR